jgi:hypothetical protein
LYNTKVDPDSDWITQRSELRLNRTKCLVLLSNRIQLFEVLFEYANSLPIDDDQQRLFRIDTMHRIQCIQWLWDRLDGLLQVI